MTKTGKSNWIRGAEAISLASRGATLWVFNPQRGWVHAGPGALERASRMEPQALWIYGVRGA